MATQVFRAGVVLVVRRNNGDILVCERGDVPHAWQLPQGGIDVGENPERAAWRELAEETGLREPCVRLEVELHEWIAYEWPDEIREQAKHGDLRRGQIQKWFVFGLTDDDNCRPAIDEVEFVAWRWMSVVDLLREVVSFRVDSYRRAFHALGLLGAQPS